MYLEERVEQLENLSVDQGKQIEIIAKGLATITTDMQKGFADMRQQQDKMQKGFADVRQQQDRMHIELTSVKTVVADLDKKFQGLDKKVDALDKKFDQKIEGLDRKVDALDRKLDQRFDDIIALIKSK